MLTILRVVKRGRRREPPTLLVRCPWCGESYQTSVWKDQARRTKSCIGCREGLKVALNAIAQRSGDPEARRVCGARRSQHEPNRVDDAAGLASAGFPACVRAG
jgi:hypothetical protein